jgi:hypothetical protein
MRFSVRLLLVVLTCLVPVILLEVWTEYSHWSERRMQRGELVMQQAQLLGGDIGSIVESGRTLLIPAPTEAYPCTQSRSPMDVMVQGRSRSLFQASQQ